MSAPAAPPAADDRARPEEVVRAVIGGIIELLRAFREELTRFQDGVEGFLGRVKGALVRSLQALQRAILNTFLALLFVTLGGVVLSIFLVAILNKYLGDPWGTGVAALALLLAAAMFASRAKSNFKEMEREASALSDRARMR
jgi:hypothetical protein